MEIQQNKCSSAEHESEIDSNSYCGKCGIYMCNKCEILHSKLFNNHQLFIIQKGNEEMFTEYCIEHKMELDFFCKTHNLLCCAACLCKIKKNEIGKHKDCEVCNIEEIKEEKKNNLKKNIECLKELSQTFSQSIEELKIMYEKMNEKKEKLKMQIQKIFTKIRNEVNNREDELLMEIDTKFNIIKEIEKLPNKIKLSLEKSNLTDKEYNDDKKLKIFINDCINIEKNIEEINILNESLKNLNTSKELKFVFNPENEEEINNFLKIIKSFGELGEESKIKSSIVGNDINNEKLIINWIKEKININKINFELIFRMSQNGSDSQDFHNYCDNKGPTLILIKTTKNKIFGGFTPLNWKTEDKSFSDETNQTFIFSLNLQKKYDLINKNNQAIINSSKKGPNFGNCDFLLYENMKQGKCYSNKFSNFLSNNNLELIGDKGDSGSFDTEEVEVFKILY